MDTRVQFEPIVMDEVYTRVQDTVGKFVPELSMPIKDILMQFGYVDQISLRKMATNGYNIGRDDDSDFDLPDFDTMDIAEKQEVYEYSKDIVAKYEAALQKQQQASHTEEVDESEIP